MSDEINPYEEAERVQARLRDLKKHTRIEYRRRGSTDIYELSYDDFKTVSGTVQQKYPFSMVQYMLRMEFGYTDFLLNLWEMTNDNIQVLR